MKKAFTLAEVLITLGIIGVVAALTLPALIQNYKRQEASTRIKKFYSVMSQAVNMSIANNGEVTSWTKIAEDHSNDANYNNAQNAYDFFMTYLAPYIKYLSIDKTTKGEEENKEYEVKVVFNDSSIAYLHNGACLDISFDYNGTKLPNTFGKDKFTFTLCTSEATIQGYYGQASANPFQTYTPVALNTREKALEKCKTNPYTCSALLKFDNWEFAKDYPHKL